MEVGEKRKRGEKEECNDNVIRGLEVREGRRREAVEGADEGDRGASGSNGSEKSGGG